MAGGGLTDFHRQKRKREIQKNKQQRIAARDEKVKETKTEASVKEEIRALERQHKTKETRPHAIQSKLDRLNKELKLVQQEKEKQEQERSQNPNNTPRFIPKAPEWKPLENPAISVYYDAVLNPYGEPPPGKPRLYHTTDGGTTMDLLQAGLPHALNHMQHVSGSDSKDDTLKFLQQLEQKDTQRLDAKNQRHQSEDEREKQRPPHQQRQGRQQQQQESQPKPSSRPAPKQKSEPALAVQRPKRYGKQTADIWAADMGEEDQAMTKTEGDAKLDQKPKSKSRKGKGEKLKRSLPTDPNENIWYYQDNSGQVQGPFSTLLMQQWIGARFFSPQQQIKLSSSGAWQELQSIPGLRESIPTQSDNNQEQVVSQAAKNIDSVQDRIQALRSDAADESSMTQMDDPENDESLQDRIAAMRQALTTHANSDTNLMEKDNAPVDDSVQARIAALRSNQESDVPDQPVGPTEDASREEVYNGPEDMADASYPVTDIPYPVQEGDMADIPYPVQEGDMADIPYPVYEEGEESMANIDYPVSEPWYQGDGEEVVEGDYPVITHEYPATEQYQSEELQEERPKKKKTKVDKAVVSLLPSHLRRKG